jgi:outer membrane biosynthesis protein TonB
MTTQTFDNPFDQEPKRSWLVYGVGILILALIALGIWQLATSQAVSIKREEPVSQLMSVVPPPPTPPPPKPQEVVKQNIPVPTTQPQQVQPKVQAPANNAITENADAQAGPGDAFNIGTGNGEGMTGGGGAGFFNPAMFNGYIASVVKIAVQKDDTLKNKSFRVAVSVWLSPQGKITKATLHGSTGSDSYDAALTALLLAMPPLEQPPPQPILARLPVEMTIDLRKSL